MFPTPVSRIPPHHLIDVGNSSLQLLKHLIFDTPSFKAGHIGPSIEQ